MFALQRRLLEEWGRRTSPGLPAGTPDRERPAAAGQIKVFRELNSSAPLLGAIVLIGLGGLFAAVDAAISTVSVARVHELVRERADGRGAAGQGDGRSTPLHQPGGAAADHL